MRQAHRAVLWVAAMIALLGAAAPRFAGAQSLPASPPPVQPQATPPVPASPGSSPSASAQAQAPVQAQGKAEYNLLIGASFSNDGQVIRSGLRWRIYASSAPTVLVKTSEDAIPVFDLEPGDYVVHATYGLASASRRITVTRQPRSERLAIAAGGLSVHGTNGGAPIDPKDIKIAVFIPSPTNDEDKLVADNLPSGDILRLPEGIYHIVTGYGSSNSTVAADIRVQAGKVVDAVVNHKAALITLKLVSQTGSEAIANTAWTVLTPGGDVIREELSAFPSMVLAEGTYTAIARNDGKTYTGDFKVSGTDPQDVEILRQDTPRPDAPRPDQAPRKETRPLTPRSPANRSAFQK